MGTCMSKDKKETAASVASVTSLSSVAAVAPSSLCSSQAQIQEFESGKLQDPTPDDQFPSRTSTYNDNKLEEDENSKKLQPAKVSYVDEAKEPTLADKHVVEIRIPVASPGKFKASPGSAKLAARALASIAASNTEEEMEEEEDVEDEREASTSEEEPSAYTTARAHPKLRNPTLVYHPSYRSRASFSRDLAAYNRDIVSISSTPLQRSPSGHDILACAVKAVHSPHYPPARVVYDEPCPSTRSRSLPKRFYSKETDMDLPPFHHKRSSSRDGSSNAKKASRNVCLDPSYELLLSPRVSLKREEASGEYRIYARQAAARKSHERHYPHASSKSSSANSSRKKERSPLRRSSTGKVADADQMRHYEDQNLEKVQTMHVNATMHGQIGVRLALKDMSVNCPPTWSDAVKQGERPPSKHYKKAAKTRGDENAKDSLSRPSVDNRAYGEGSMAGISCHEASLYCGGKVDMVSTNVSANKYPGSMERIRAIIEALAELNIENTLPSEIEESETEVESDVEFLHTAFATEFSPQMELHAQQARNFLLKEAAMDAFARPSFYSSMGPGENDDSKSSQPGLAALMASRLADTEADTAKIRKVLKLLSMAESEMGKDQKTIFYNQLGMVLDSVKTQTTSDKELKQDAMKASEMVKDKAVTSRANSWPRSVRGPVSTVNAVDNIGKEVSAFIPSVNQSLSSGFPVTQTGESVALESAPGAACINTPDDVKSNKHDLEGNVVKASTENVQPQESECSTVTHANEHVNVTRSPLPTEEDQLQIEQHLCPKVTKNDNVVSKSIIDALGSSTGIDDSNVDACKTVSDCLCEQEATNKVEQTVQVTSDPLELSAEKELESPQPPTNDTNGPGVMEGLHTHDTSDTEDLPKQDPVDLPTNDTDGPGVMEGLPTHDTSDTEDLPKQDPLDADNTEVPNRKVCRCDEASSDASFEFRVRSNASTPLSTPSTPMISTASTPRRLYKLNSALTADEIAEIWEAFE